MTKGELYFPEDKEELEENVTKCLNLLAEVKAYTLKPEEVQSFKAAQYGLRDICEDFKDQDLREAFDE